MVDSLQRGWIWARRNVFRGPGDVALTLGALMLIVFAGLPLLRWVFLEARWAVVGANLHLFLVGSYPPEALWRVWAVVWALLACVGLSSARLRWTREARRGALAGLFAVVVLAALAESAGPLIAAAAFAGGHALVRWRRPGARALLAVWAAYAALTLLLLGGIEDSAWLPAVPTQRWGGFLLTALITAVGILVSFPLGVALALGRRGNLPIIRGFCIAYIELIRGVPLITVLFMGQLLIPLFLPPGWAIDNLIRVMAAVIIFSSAYMAENVRGGLQAVPRGQIEAAQALGLNAVQTTFLVVLPQALRHVIPAIVGQCIALFKDTSLVTIIGLIDFLAAGQASFAQAEFAGREAEVYLFVAAVYWMFSFAFSHTSRRLEARLGVGER
jgi:general L-amino acid transport system permease protein